MHRHNKVTQKHENTKTGGGDGGGVGCDEGGNAGGDSGDSAHSQSEFL
jgi:hypothetical protein